MKVNRKRWRKDVVGRPTTLPSTTMCQDIFLFWLWHYSYVLFGRMQTLDSLFKFILSGVVRDWEIGIGITLCHHYRNHYHPLPSSASSSPSNNLKTTRMLMMLVERDEKTNSKDECMHTQPTTMGRVATNGTTITIGRSCFQS